MRLRRAAPGLTQRQTAGCHAPALFCHGLQDSLIGHAHSVRLEELYAGDCRLMLVDGDHNDPRPAEFFDRCQGFFLQVLQGGGVKEQHHLFHAQDLRNPFGAEHSARLDERSRRRSAELEAQASRARSAAEADARFHATRSTEPAAPPPEEAPQVEEAASRTRAAADAPE